MDNNYSKGYIVFMDILGFSKYIKNSDSIEVLKNIFDYAEKIKYLYNNSNISQIKITFFSDSFVLTSNEVSEQSFISLMMACHLINLEIYQQLRLFTRGAVTYGKYYHQDNIAFGPGIIDAYKIQEEDAKYIRMIVSKNVEEGLRNWNVKDAYIQKSSDGFWYFNWYTLALSDANKENEFNLIEAEKIIEESRRVIVNMLEEYKETTIYEKYLWLTIPFNKCCEIMVLYGIESFKKYNIKVTN